MNEDEIKLLNDLASSLCCYFTGDWTHWELMHNLKDNLGLPSDVLEHVETILPIK